MGQVHAMSNRPIKSFHNQQISCSISSSQLLCTNYSRLHNKHSVVNGSFGVVETRQRLCHLRKFCWCLWYRFLKRMWNQLQLVRISEEDTDADPAMLMSRQPRASLRGHRARCHSQPNYAIIVCRIMEIGIQYCLHRVELPAASSSPAEEKRRGRYSSLHDTAHLY